MRKRLGALVVLAGMAAGSSLFAGGGCSNQLWRFNPCGTILPLTVCTPEEWYARLFDTPDWNVDPACPIPFQCQ